MSQAIHKIGQTIYVVFDGPPGPQPGRFVEVEDEHGASVGVGEWAARPNGWWTLRLEVVSNDVSNEAQS